MDAAADAATLTIDRLALLQFLDEKSADSIGHVTGIVNLVGEDLNAACFQHYAEAKGANIDVMWQPVTTGKQRGPRLDRWIKADWPDGSKTLYQTEIKNWSAHSFGGKTLPIGATHQEITDYKQKRWYGTHWNSKALTLNDRGCAKVLVPMRPPPGLASRTILPLLIFWETIGPASADIHLFSVATSSPDFPELSVFSVSSYLRSLKETQLRLVMPRVVRRIRALNRMFPTK